MRRYVLAYAVWLASVLSAAAVALWWYKRVEEIGWQEVAQRAAAGNGKPPDPDPELVPDATGSA